MFVHWSDQMHLGRLSRSPSFSGRCTSVLKQLEVNILALDCYACARSTFEALLLASVAWYNECEASDEGCAAVFPMTDEATSKTCVHARTHPVFTCLGSRGHSEWSAASRGGVCHS